jgi:hypothetical protein
MQNSIEAGATKILLEVNEDMDGFFTFSITDNGRGMSEDMLKKIRDPFVTTRLTRKVGMGIPFVDMTTAQSGGQLIIKSKLGAGTSLKASYLRNHLDCPPLGDIVNTIKVFLVGNSRLHFVMHYRVRKAEFVFDSQDVIMRLGEKIDFSYPEVYSWLEEYLKQEIDEVRKAGGLK